MLYQLRYYRNPNFVEIELFDIQESVAGADVNFHHTEKKPRPPFIEALFAHKSVLEIYVSGTAPKLSIVKRDRSTWEPLLKKVLKTLRDHFDPQGPLTVNGPAISLSWKYQGPSL